MTKDVRIPSKTIKIKTQASAKNSPVNPVTQKSFQIVRLDTLKPSPLNAREHSEKQIDMIADSMRKFGFISPLVVDGKFEIVAGHGRYEAAKKAGIKAVPIVRIEHLTEAEIRAYRLVDNRIAEESIWNEKALATEIDYLIQAELNCEIDFSVEITGFSTPFIDTLFIEEEEGVISDEEAETPLILQNKPPVATLGDIWTLGQHRVACGDSRDTTLNARLFGKEQVQLLCSDPPYNLKISGFVSGKGAVKHKEFRMCSGEMSKEEFIDFLHQAFSAAFSRLDDGGCFYIFIDWRHLEEVQKLIPELEIRNNPLKYLNFISNRFGVNPRPKLALLVEGKSEEKAVENIFEDYFGTNIGTYGIEIITLKGVENATGGKEGGHQSILRLIDYLHHHQTFALLMLDNEGDAKKIREKAKKAASIHHDKRYVTRLEYIKIWKTSFEFDNFSSTEIAVALTELAMGNAHFSSKEILNCKNAGNPGATLTKLYKAKTNYGLNKINFCKILIRNMLTQDKIASAHKRPIIKFLEKAAQLAGRNPFPTMQELWELNQSSKFLGKKRKPPKKASKKQQSI